MTTSSASMQLLPPSIISPPPTSLAHSTLTHLAPYHIPTLPPPIHPPPTSLYLPRPTFPPTSSTLLTPSPSSSSSPTSSSSPLLTHLLHTNRAREQADARLKAEVTHQVERWREGVATATSQGVRMMEERTFERARKQWQRWEEAKEEEGKEVGKGGGKGWAGGGEPPRVGVIGYSHTLGGERVEWEVKEEAATADDRKKSKKEREKEDAERRQRELSLSHSPLSSPPAPPSLPFPAHEAVYLGSALPVTLSSYASADPLPTSEQARGLLSPSHSHPPPTTPWVAPTSPPPANPLLSLYAGATLLPSPPLASSQPNAPPLLPAVQPPLPAGVLVVQTMGRVREEVVRCKAGLVAAGVWVHEGVLETGLGGGEGGLGGVGGEVGGGGGGWPVPFAGLVDDPKQKRKGTTEKKPVAKGGKAGKKK